jgi:DNA-binding transcriptional MocR family regulator
VEHFLSWHHCFRYYFSHNGWLLDYEKNNNYHICMMQKNNTNLSDLGSENAKGIPANPLRALFPLAAQSGMISLANGHPSPDARDAEGLNAAVALASDDLMAWRYGPSQGDPDLRAQLAAITNDNPEAVIITSGSQQGIDLAIRAALNSGAQIGIPQAVYPATLSVLAANGVQSVTIAEDSDGLMVEALRNAATTQGIAAIYMTPTFGNPTGVTMSLARRRALLDVCAEHAIVVIEDDPYRDLWFDVPPPPSFWELSKTDYPSVAILSLRSASKTVAPGLRIGWMLAHKSLHPLVCAIKQASDLQACGLAQRTVLRYLKTGRMPDWLSRVRVLYRGRHDALVAGLLRNGFTPEPVSGGMFVWVSIPNAVDAARLFDCAVARNVLYAPGAGFAGSSADKATEPYMRLCFAGQTAEDIAVACDRLGAALLDAQIQT